MVLDDAHLATLSVRQLDDAIVYFAPDVIVHPDVITSSRHRTKHRGLLERDLEAEIVPLGRRTRTRTRTGAPDPTPAVFHFDNVDLVVTTADEELASIGALERDGTLDVATETYVLTDRLEVSVDLTSLSTSLAGLESYRAALAPESLEGSYTHLSTAASASYRREWDGLTVYGIASDGAMNGEGKRVSNPELTSSSLHTDGIVRTSGIDPSRLGIQALDGVGPTIARRLRDAGYPDRSAIADANVRELLEIDGIGRAKADQLHEHARAFVEGTVVCDGDRYFPNGEPVFVDIETDGLTPTIVWLVGVLDRGTSSYLSFLQRDPEDPGGGLAAFMSWYAANATDRPIVAYNGRGFDFRILREHIQRHCPEHLDVWENACTFDPYSWAVHDGNALFPGRTNRLDDVASALGWESDRNPGSDNAALNGATVARIYRRWMRDRRDESEPDWERLEAYCEADVRALAYVYDALDDARRTTSTSTSTGGRSADESSVQGELTDFYS